MKTKISIVFFSLLSLTSMAQINGGFFIGQDYSGNFYTYFQGTNVINSSLKIEILSVNENTKEKKSWNCNLGVNNSFTIGPNDNWYWMPGEKLIINYPNGKSVYWVYAPAQNSSFDMNRDIMTPAWMDNVPDVNTYNKHNNSTAKSGRAKAEIDIQINKIEKNLRDVRQSYENCSSVTLKPSYYQMIQKYEEMLRNLKNERIYAM